MILPRPRTDLPELGEVAQALTRLGERLEASPADSLVDAVVRCAVEWVDGAR